MMEFLQAAERDVAGLQRDMGQLENVRRRLAEFFCEDVNSFKLEECFRIFHGFYCKFRQAVAENARRRLQEEQANARRRQREELLATKRRQSKLHKFGRCGELVLFVLVESLAGTPDSECSFLDTQIYDSRSFSAKRVSFGVSNRIICNESVNFQGKKSEMTSEDEISIAGSPLVTRRRLGSFNGQNASASSKDEKSPGNYFLFNPFFCKKFI